MKKQTKIWEKLKRTPLNSPQYPNEALVKLLFGSYLKNKIEITEKTKVLDVGCGFGNNLVPFLDKGCECFGVEISEDVVAQANDYMSADFRLGTNRELPFGDKTFDIVLSINTIHYEAQKALVEDALKEFYRVLRPNGHLILFTVGKDHCIIKSAVRVEPNVYRIQNFDFRDGSKLYCFESEDKLRQSMEVFFQDVETGNVTEKLMNKQLDFLIGVGRK